MLSRLQARLSYANVMSTLAVFLAVGGGLALALDRNSVKSRHIAPDQVRKADTSDSLRLECRSGTRYHQGACIETDNRSSQTLLSAFQDCRDEGRTLPTPAQLGLFRLEPGIDLGSGEWTFEFTQDLTSSKIMGDDGNLSNPSGASAFPYRCAVRAKR